MVRSNAYIAILDRSPAPADLPPSHVKYFQTEITEVDQIERAVEQTIAWTKETGAALGGVINCAGVGTAAKIIDAQGEPHSLDLWNYTLAVNLTGTFNLTRLALKHMVKVQPEDGADGERGVVIFVSSAAAVSFSQIHLQSLQLVADILSVVRRPSRPGRICGVERWSPFHDATARS